MITTGLILVGLAAVGYVLVSRLQGRRVNLRRLLVLPVVLSVIGLLQVTGTAGRGLRPADVVMITAGVVAAATLGVARGATVAVFSRNGEPWLRYRPATLALWGATIAVRIGLTAVSFGVGASLATRGPAILLSVGTTLLAEGLVVARKALSFSTSSFSTSESRWQARPWRHDVTMH
jgi:hypothetical protein